MHDGNVRESMRCAGVQHSNRQSVDHIPPARPMDVERRDSQKVLLPDGPSRLPYRSPSVPNFSRASLQDSQALVVGMEPTSRLYNLSSPPKSPSRPMDIKRWDGHTRTYTEWDGLRKDLEIFHPTGDCLIHLYTKGHSRRGPSLRVPFDAIKSKGCGPLFAMCFAQMTPPQTPQVSDDESSHSDSDFSTVSTLDGKYELYIPAPVDAMREDAFRYHMTTRNFFAWMLDVPLVGATLGKSLVDLFERMLVFRGHERDSVADLLSYAQRMGYLNFGHSPDYALAFLHFAEQFRLRDLWIDAFAHCVGMNESLCLSLEFDAVSRVSKALITRAYLEMDLHLGRVTRALSGFLEDELSPAQFGLSAGARDHLDRFSTFLHSFYVEKFGYWPPPQGLTFSKALLRSMYYEFRNLYDFLVDRESTPSLQDQPKPASGGICVLQNVHAFNERHNYEALPHPLPLIPDCQDRDMKTQSQRSLRALKLGTKASKAERCHTTRTALANATNQDDPDIVNCSLVQEYMQFEREWSCKPEEKVSLTDARKVRWIVVYCTLQMLVSVTRAPKEVRDAEGPSYPLCCLTTGTPPWLTSTEATKVQRSKSSASLAAFTFHNSPPESVGGSTSPPLSIHPDCESDDYFSHTPTTHTRKNSNSSLTPAPLRINTAVSRTSSIRSFRKSMMSNFSRRNSTPKPSSPLSPSSFHEIMVHGYGNGLNAAFVKPTTSSSPSSSPSRRAPPPGTLDLSRANIKSQEARTPTLDQFMLDNGPTSAPTSPASTALVSPTASSLFSYREDSSTNGTSSALSSKRNSTSKIYSMDHESDCNSRPALVSPSIPSSPASKRLSTGSTAPFTNAAISKYSALRKASIASICYSDAPTAQNWDSAAATTTAPNPSSNRHSGLQKSPQVHFAFAPRHLEMGYGEEKELFDFGNNGLGPDIEGALSMLPGAISAQA